MKHRQTAAQQAERRRLYLLALLHKRPHSREEIITSLEHISLFPDDHAWDAKTRMKRHRYLFNKDLRLLRTNGYQIVFDSTTQWYAWSNSPFALFLTSEQLMAFAVLIDTFASLTIPHADELRSLLSALAARLSAEQQDALRAGRRMFGILIQETSDYEHCDPITIRTIEKAIQYQRHVEFRYRSRDGVERRHIIEPSPWFLKNGHAYFKGWSLEYEKVLSFRLDYVVAGSAHLLSTTSLQSRPQPRTYCLRYTLDKAIARGSVSEHFPHQQVAWDADGTATITAQISDLFEAQQVILKYGEYCVVQSPPELLELMRRVAQHYDKSYLTPDP